LAAADERVLVLQAAGCGVHQVSLVFKPRLSLAARSALENPPARRPQGAALKHKRKTAQRVER
ncbi:hypothetical protein, partial [Klebsiella pneumoniae]|uniref:hypothetical protein n=1 Tax=Klebsiella pneumoniae TaxID=573 RepID=UPI00272FBA81